MRDHRAEALAQILVRYSTKVAKGDVCVVQGTTTAEPLVLAVYEEVLRAGGLPILQMSPEEAPAAFLYDVRAVAVVPKDLSVEPFNENYPFTVFFASIKPSA